MAKGSVRKKGKKWYYRFYVEDASGKMVQKEYAGTESKSETEKLLRKALEDYEDKKFVAKADNLTVGELLDMWAEEELKTGTLSNGTVENYLGAIRCIKKHPIADRKLKTVTAEHLQGFLDLLTFGGEFPDGKVRKGYSKDYIHSFSAVLQQSFRFAVFPKQLISFNPMQYIKLKRQAEEVDLFSDDEVEESTQPISHEDYERLIKYLEKKNPPAILPIQIAYYAGLRIGETCGLTWQDINLEEQCLTIKRSIRYDGMKHKNIIGPTKRKKVRIVDFGDTLTENTESYQKRAAQKPDAVWRTLSPQLLQRSACEKTGSIMNTIILTVHRKSRQITKKSPLSACDRMAPWNCRVHSALYADQCQRNWKDLKISISTSYVTPTPAICFPMGLHRKMYRNC